MRKSKKGVVEVQFNWVFIMIAGVVILGFFISFSGKIKDREEDKIAIKVLADLSQIATSSHVSDNTNTNIKVKDMDLFMDCDPGLCNEFGCGFEMDLYQKSLNAPAWMDIEPIFAPHYLKGDELIPWSLPWSSPYKVANFLYLTTPDIKYVIVADADDSLADTVFNKMRENENLAVVKATYANADSIRYNGEAQIKFVYFRAPTGSIPPLDAELERKDKWNVVYITGNEEHGMVHFSDTESYPYVDIPMLIGAIYSDDLDYYKCNVMKSFIKLDKINAIYKHRTQALTDHYTANPGVKNCQVFYNPVNGMINSIDGAIGDVEDMYDFDTADATTIVDNKNQMLGQNRLALNKVCPRLF